MENLLPVTPLRKGYPGQPVLFNGSVASSPLRKGANVIFSTPVKVGSSNDNAERTERRNIADIQRRLSAVPVSPIVSAESPQVPDRECREHITSVLKLFAENKINYKNVWNLKFIDYMRKLFRNQGFGRDSLRMATTSLDAGAKVYSMRVDDLHSDGMKLASNMARYDQRNETNQDEGEGDAGSEVQKRGERVKQPKKTRISFKKGVKNTIVKDIKTVIGEYPKLESAFFQTKNDVKNFGSTSLFTLNLPKDYFGNMHFPNTKEPFSYEDPNKPIESVTKVPFEIIEMQVRICPQFAGFEINEWDRDKEDDLIYDEVVRDEHGIPIHELDGSFHDILAAVNPDPFTEHRTDEEEDVQSNFLIRDDNISHLANYHKHTAVELEDDYLYRLMCHAGPSHWKFMHVNRANSKFPEISAQQKRNKANKKTKADVSFNFVDLPRMTPEYTKRKFTLNVDFEKITCPHIPLFESMGRGLMTRDLDIESTNTKSLGQRNYEAEPYNCENRTDAEYCLQMFADDNANYSECCSQNPTEEEEFVQQQGPMTGDNLIDAPELVPKHNMRYATKAKKMDMKKLKNVMWKCVVSDETLPYEAVNEQDMHLMRAKPHTFLEIMGHLPSKLNNKMRKELSTPLAFVALLHLANEHNLKFIDGEGLKDFGIVQDKIKGG